MNLEQINEILSFVVFSYNDIQLTVAKIIQVPLILFAMWFVVTDLMSELLKSLMAVLMIFSLLFIISGAS